MHRQSVYTHEGKLGSHLRTPALKTENFSEKIGRLVTRKNGFTKTLFSLFSRVFLSKGWF